MDCEDDGFDHGEALLVAPQSIAHPTDRRTDTLSMLSYDYEAFMSLIDVD